VVEELNKYTLVVVVVVVVVVVLVICRFTPNRYKEILITRQKRQLLFSSY
jgi:uncharacterized protein involved in outer membrane biogenesis